MRQVSSLKADQLELTSACLSSFRVMKPLRSVSTLWNHWYASWLTPGGMLPAGEKDLMYIIWNELSALLKPKILIYLLREGRNDLRQSDSWKCACSAKQKLVNKKRKILCLALVLRTHWFETQHGLYIQYNCKPNIYCIHIYKCVWGSELAAAVLTCTLPVTARIMLTNIIQQWHIVYK